MTTLIPKFDLKDGGATPTGAVNRPINEKLAETVSVLDFGATGDGTTDDSAAIQAAINTGNSIYFPLGTYAVGTTIRLKNNGQILYGDGCGYASELGRTIIKWIGASSGTIISFATGAGLGAVNNASIRDMDINGNSLAQIGVEVYDNSASAGGGCWRNELSNVSIRNVTQGTPRGIELGHSNTAPNFANDFKMYNGGIYNCTKGLWGNGAIYNLYNVTASSNSECVIYAESGSTWGLFGVIFSANGIDIKAFNPQSISTHGGWFENSTNGVYSVVTGSTQNSCGFFGSYLHTSGVTQLMDMKSAAGSIALDGCFVPSAAGSNLINNVNATYPISLAGNTNITFASATTQTGVNPTFGKTNFGSSNGQQNAVYQNGLAAGGTLSLPLSVNNQTFIGFVVAGHYNASAAGQRTTATYSVFYYQADNTTITQIASANGTSSALSFTLTASGNNLILTNTSSATSNAYIVAIGSGMAI